MPVKFSTFMKMTPEERKALPWKEWPTAYRRMWTIGLPVVAILTLIIALVPGDPPSPAELAAQATADSLKKAEAALLKKYPNLPRQSGFDASVDVVVDYLSATLNDPRSYQPESWSALISTSDGYFQVRHTFRAKNGFGGMILGSKVFVIDSFGSVVRVAD